MKNNEKTKPWKKLTEDLKKQNPSKEKLASLSRAFELFSIETDRLEDAYNSLKDEFASIHQELESTNKKLIRKVAELDVMTFYFESILGNISQGLLFIDLNGDVTTYNTAAEQILQVKSEQVLFRPFWQNFKDKKFGFSIRESLGSKCPPPAAHTIVENKEGEEQELEINITYVKEESKPGNVNSNEVTLKKLEGIILLIRDITEIRNLQRIATRNDRMKELGEMAAMVAHEIRNPLGGIKGFASLLKRDLKNSPTQEKMAENIVTGTETLNRLVTNVLNYSRQMVPKTAPTNIINLLEELKIHFDADIARHQKKIKTVIKTKLSTLMLLVDAHLFKSALLNLLINANDAMPEGGTITVTVAASQNKGVIQISDTGYGISEVNLEKIFTPFFTTKADGNGFGLSEVYKVIQAHEGTISVKSAVGKGTDFTIKIPLIKKSKATVQKTANR